MTFSPRFRFRGHNGPFGGLAAVVTCVLAAGLPLSPPLAEVGGAAHRASRAVTQPVEGWLVGERSSFARPGVDRDRQGRGFFPRTMARPSAPVRAAFVGQGQMRQQPLGLVGHVVKYWLGGYEPDLDPIYRVIITARLRDRADAAGSVPDTTLIISGYLENFQPTTTPVLPDLLHQDREATGLGGFLQGKAALVDGAGHIAYKGSLVAETFLDNSVEMIVDVDRLGAPDTFPSLRLLGTFTLRADRSIAGALRLARALRSSELSALRVGHPRPVAWQSIVARLTVHIPRMMGTMPRAAAGTPVPTQAPPTLPKLAPASTAPGSLVAAGRQKQAQVAARPGQPALIPVGIAAAAVALCAALVLVMMRYGRLRDWGANRKE